MTTENRDSPVENLVSLKRFSVITFRNITDALRAEKVLKEFETLPSKIMPIPSMLSSSCVLSIQTTNSCSKEIVEVLTKASIIFYGVFDINNETKTAVRIL